MSTRTHPMKDAAYREAERKLWQSVDVQADEKMIRLATTGTGVRLQIIGDGDPVLFIHGGPNSGSTWAPIVNAFPDTRASSSTGRAPG